MNNARRILSKGSTLLRGCWFWSKKLLFRKKFDENFNAVERVRCPLFDFFFDGHDPHRVEHENPGTNKRFLGKGVGSFSKGVGVVIGHLLVCQKGGFSEENSSASTIRREETAWHGMLWAHPVMTVTQSGLGLLVSGSSAQLPRALNRLPESLL